MTSPALALRTPGPADAAALADLHGTGAGQLLLDAVLGDSPALLWVAKDNPRARRFYARNGFAADGAEEEAMGLTVVRMVR